MHSPHPPRPPFPPRPGSPPGESDRDLLALLGGPDAGRHHAVALLLARHWRATRDYAVVCLAAAGPSAQLVASASVQRVLGRAAGGAAGGALRPQLLVAVRETVRAWAADPAACVVVPELRKPTGGRGLRAAMPGTPERRQLAERAFQALPGASQCLLWHTEVEAEPINIPAGLLGIDVVTAAAALEQAREQFRAGCVRAHRELAPSRECRFHNRLLDVPIRRGGSLLPDVRQHLTSCRHCRYAAEQLAHVEDGLDVLLAETVLGWGARRYLDSRPGRGAADEWPPESRAPLPAAGGRHRTTPEGRRRTVLAVGVGLASLVLLATVLVAKGWSGDNAVPGPEATWGAPVGRSVRPGATGSSGATGSTGATGPSGATGADGERPSVASPSAALVGEPVEVAHGRLRSLGSGRCLDARGGGAVAGAAVRLVECSSAGSQQWSYQDDGLLRSAADPTLCLAADPGTRAVVVSGCVVHAGEVAYDLTVRGELLLRGSKGLALSPGSGDSSGRVVVAARDGSGKQRWVLEPGVAGVPRGVPDAPDPGRPEPSRRSVRRPGEDAPRQKPGPGTRRPGREEEYEPRIAQVGTGDAPAPVGPAAPRDAVDALVPPVTGTVASASTDVASASTDLASASTDLASVSTSVGSPLG